MQSLLVIIGPTASGKSALAMAVARRVRAEILGVDSMTIYQGLDIGTAKPSLAERHEFRHHLVDWLRPDEPFSVARFVELADRTIEDCRRRGVPVIATGGTPLYYKALFDGLFDGPSADESIRQRLADVSGEELHAQLSQVDPAAASRIHSGDHRRLVRALEVFELTGQPISSFQTDWESKQGPRHKAVWVGLLWDKETLNRRINARVKDMIDAGWLDEVRELLRKFPKLSKTAAEATGYRELIDHLQGKLSLPDAIEEIKIATRQLGRRQMKWFRRFSDVHWLRGEKPLEENVEEAIRLWQAGPAGA